MFNNFGQVAWATGAVLTLSASLGHIPLFLLWAGIAFMFLVTVCSYK